MTVHARHPATPEEFLRWNEGREGKREFVRGRVEEMMINVTRNHVRLASALTVALVSRLDRTAFDIGSADFGVRTPDGIRYPDVFVDRRSSHSKGGDLAATEPILLAEILSSSSVARDFIDKLQDYSGVSSLREYLILSQDEPRAWLWSRADDDLWPKKPQEIAGDEESLFLPGLGIAIPMAELYAGVERRP